MRRGKLQNARQPQQQHGIDGRNEIAFKSFAMGEISFNVNEGYRKPFYLTGYISFPIRDL